MKLTEPGRMSIEFITGDCQEVMGRWPDGKFDLVFGSPPYEDCRSYEGLPPRKGQDWVDWMVEVVRESLRVCRGLVAFVVEGKTDKFRWSATPVLLMADLHRAGICLRKPPLYRRDGIPGSGGPDWLKNHYEFIVCATNGGRLPWSDNKVMGHPPKYGPGGPPSHRTTATRGHKGGDARVQRAVYKPPKVTKTNNIIDCGPGGGGRIGSRLAHEGEAPFPEYLAEVMVRSFCPPDGLVLDPFSGTGTTMVVCARFGRNGVGVDLRESQTAIGKRRLEIGLLLQKTLPG